LPRIHGQLNQRNEEVKIHGHIKALSSPVWQQDQQDSSYNLKKKKTDCSIEFLLNLTNSLSKNIQPKKIYIVQSCKSEARFSIFKQG
jgi:hypothetical protein